MRKDYLFIFGIIAVGLSVLIWRSSDPQQTNINQPTSMLIASPAFQDGASIPTKFTCDGGNMNPQLDIENVPHDAKSLTLIVEDPDAPRATPFTHWILWNIDPSTTVIKEESVPPKSVEGMNDAQKPGYLGPCPPPGKSHRYFFKLYALDTILNLQEDSSKPELMAAIKNHVIGEAELIGLYKRG